MDVQEVRKLDAYLKRLFGNARIRVVPGPKKEDSAEVYIGEEDLGKLILDDEDGDLSYNFSMEIELGGPADIQADTQLTAYLKHKFGNEKIRVLPRAKKTDSLEAYIGDEFIGVLFIENEKGHRSYNFEITILDVDIVD